MQQWKEDREKVLADLCNEKLREEEIIDACSKGLICLQDLSDVYTNDRKFAIMYAKTYQCPSKFHVKYKSLSFFSENVRKDKDVVLTFLEQGYWDSLRYASDEIKRDRELLLFMAKKGIPIYGASKSAFRSAKFSTAFLQACPTDYPLPQLRVFPKQLRNKEFISMYYQKNEYAPGMHIEDFPEDLKNDLEFLLSLNIRKKDILQYGGDEIKDNEKLVTECCDSRFCSSFEYASERIKNDKEIVLCLYKQNRDVRKYAGKKLLDDKKFAIEACHISGKIFENLSEELRDDEEVARLAFTTEPFMITYASDKIKSIKELALECCKREIKAYPSIGRFHKEDSDFVSVLIENIRKVRSEWVVYLPDAYQNDKDFMKQWLSHNGGSYKYLPETMKKDKEIALIALEHGEMLSEVHPDLLDDFEFAYEYLSVCRAKGNMIGYDFEYLSEKNRNDPIILLMALDKHIPHVYYWQCDDVGNMYEINYYDLLKSKCFQDEEFTKIIINAFFKTPFSNEYDYNEVMKNPFSIYEIMKELLDKRDLFFFEDHPDPSIGLQFADEIERMMQEREK